MNKWHDDLNAGNYNDTAKKYAGTIFTHAGQVYKAQTIAVVPVNTNSAPKGVRPKQVRAESAPIIYATVAGTSTTVLFSALDVCSRFEAVVEDASRQNEILLYYARGSMRVGPVPPTCIYLNSLDELDFNVPPLGYVNTLFGALYYSRVPRRHWRKGLCDDAVEVTTPRLTALLHDKLGLGGIEVFGVDRNAKELMFPKYTTAIEALGIMEAGDKYAVALSKNICLSFIPNKKYFGVMYKNLFVGALAKEGGVWSVELLKEAAPFKEEVLSTLGGVHDK